MLNKKKGRKEGGEVRRERKEGRERRERRGRMGGRKEERKGRKRTGARESACVNCSKDEIAGNVHHSLVCSHYLYFTVMSTAK